MARQSKCFLSCVTNVLRFAEALVEQNVTAESGKLQIGAEFEMGLSKALKFRELQKPLRAGFKNDR